MKTSILSNQEVLAGYDAVCELYPYVPPLSHWRAWEYAAYQRYQLAGRILDLGCGNGKYFRLLWPNAEDVVGVDIDPKVAQVGKQSGVYADVHVAPAHQVPEADESFDHVFANCSLEHMDKLDQVLDDVYRCLKPGGSLLCSVVTDRFITWSVLPYLVSSAGFDQAAMVLRNEFIEFHHLMNPLSLGDWKDSFIRADLVPENHIPIVPKHNSGLFLMMNNLWHLKRIEGGEIGDVIHPFLLGNSNFPSAFRKVFEGFLEMETEPNDCSGAVFLCKKPV
ncbi:MAG: class I SAM-dependent methyltransferase [Cyanobacteria bacterium P01_H01_bin.26]